MAAHIEQEGSPADQDGIESPFTQMPPTSPPQTITQCSDLDARAERIVASVPPAPAPKPVEPKK
jgi:hypothetical protein